MAAAERKFSIEDVFGIVYAALMPYYLDKTVKITIEKNDEDAEIREVSELELIMHSIGHEMADRWVSEKEEVLEGMHKALDPIGYDEFIFDIDSSVGMLSYHGGSRRKSRKSRKSRKLRH